MARMGKSRQGGPWCGMARQVVARQGSKARPGWASPGVTRPVLAGYQGWSRLDVSMQVAARWGTAGQGNTAGRGGQVEAPLGTAWLGTWG